jgi:PPM family protein phosphatase
MFVESNVRLSLRDTIYEGEVRGRVGWLEAMRDLFAEAAYSLVLLARAIPKLARMRTTLTCVVVEDDQLVFGHVGDCRAYLFRAGTLHQLTTDHTEATDLVTDGRLSPADAMTHSSRTVLTRWLSAVPSSEEPEVGSLTVAHGDLILVCSDGLHHAVPPDQIATILARTAWATDDDPIHPVALALVDRAIANGGSGDVTVVLAACLPS